MAEQHMIDAVQAALEREGIDDKVEQVGQFEPRGNVGSLFAGSMIGGSAGSAFGQTGEIVGDIAGTLAGPEINSSASGLPREMLVGASSTTVYGFQMGRGGRRAEPRALLFAVPIDKLSMKVHGRVNVRILELTDAESGSKIELEGNRLPITHSHDLIQYLAGEEAAQKADTEAGDA
jgi:hypothetical protein